jgi:hypothetical protein
VDNQKAFLKPRQTAVYHTPRQQRRNQMRSIIAAIAAMVLFPACLTVAPSKDSSPWTLFFD